MIVRSQPKSLCKVFSNFAGFVAIELTNLEFPHGPPEAQFLPTCMRLGQALHHCDSELAQAPAAPVDREPPRLGAGRERTNQWGSERLCQARQPLPPII